MTNEYYIIVNDGEDRDYIWAEKENLDDTIISWLKDHQYTNKIVVKIYEVFYTDDGAENHDWIKNLIINLWGDDSNDKEQME